MKKRIVSILLALILTLQLGIIGFAADVETPSVSPDAEVQINGLSLVLSGEIGLTFHVYVSKKYRGGTMTLEFAEKEDNKPITVNIADCHRDGSLRYTATYYLSAVELAEPVLLTVCDAVGNTLARKKCSAKEYADFLIKDEIATEAEKNIAKSLINYGHFAQIACSEANGWVIGEDYAEIAKYYTPTVDNSAFDGYSLCCFSSSEDVHRLSMSLRLDYKTGIVLHIPADEKPTVTVNGEEVEAVLSERIENAYEIEIPGINALNLTDEYTVKINDITVILCAFSYCKLAVDHNTRQSVIDAVKALYEFYDATDKYLNPVTK